MCTLAFCTLCTCQEISDTRSCLETRLVCNSSIYFGQFPFDAILLGHIFTVLLQHQRKMCGWFCRARASPATLHQQRKRQLLRSRQPSLPRSDLSLYYSLCFLSLYGCADQPACSGICCNILGHSRSVKPAVCVGICLLSLLLHIFWHSLR